MDNFNAKIEAFNAGAARTVAAAARSSVSNEDFWQTKNAVMGAINRYASCVYNSCERVWPINLREDVKAKILEYLKDLGFETSDLPPDTRPGFVVKW